MNGVNLSGDLPDSGMGFSGWVSGDEIALRVGDRLCVAHKQWMTPDEARRVGEALLHLAADPVGPQDERPARPQLHPLAKRERGTVALDGSAGPPGFGPVADPVGLPTEPQED